MAINRIVLQLASEECGLSENASLFQTEIQREEHPEPLICIRGKTAGAYRGAGTFQWTRAVHGITLLLLLHKLQGADAPMQRAIIL